jgi:hypothetical protein
MLGYVKAFSVLQKALVFASIDAPKGNKNSFDHARKVMILSFTFLELGQAAVSDGSGWIVPVCVRDVTLNQVGD